MGLCTSRPLFVGRYLQLCGGFFASEKKEQKAKNDKPDYWTNRIRDTAFPGQERKLVFFAC